MTNKNQSDFNTNNPREVPTRKDPGEITLDKAPDHTPGKSNPINPETDEPNHPKNRKDDSKIKNPIQDDPGKQITS